jgi:signal transduction histidine kinase
MPPQPGLARTDVRKVRQILVNLLGNAVKFTDAGTIEFEIAAASDNLALHMRDTGRGIAADQLENIFDPFHQLDSGKTRQAEGSGLGLAVSRRLARLLGGDIEVHSEVGVGSEFIVRLPLR